MAKKNSNRDKDWEKGWAYNIGSVDIDKEYSADVYVRPSNTSGITVDIRVEGEKGDRYVVQHIEPGGDAKARRIK